MIVAWRIDKKRRAAAAFTGEGARRFGGRWNHKGTPVIYLSESLSLAALEKFVHLPRRAARNIKFVSIRVSIPEDLVHSLSRRRLPPNWREEPPPIETQDLGTDWAVACKQAVLRVPSVIIPTQCNYMVNPQHHGSGKLHVFPPESFSFDPRMWK